MRRKSLDFKSNIYQHGSRAEHEAWGPVEPSDMTENRTSEDEEEKQTQKLRWIFERKRLDCHEHQKAEKHEAETEDPNIGEDRNRAEAAHSSFQYFADTYRVAGSWKSLMRQDSALDLAVGVVS